MSTGRVEWSTDHHASRYLARRARMGRRADGDAVLDELVPIEVARVLDLGTGDGHLVGLLQERRPKAHFTALDISPPLLAAAAERFASAGRVEFLEHDLTRDLPPLGRFDAVVSAFAIHHLEDDRKISRIGEVLRLLEPGGVFVNLEHVSSPTPDLHLAFLEAIGYTPEEEDASNRCIDVETQLGWLRECGFTDVDCLWKWREMALLVGVCPGE